MDNMGKNRQLHQLIREAPTENYVHLMRNNSIENKVLRTLLLLVNASVVFKMFVCCVVHVLC